MLPRLRRADGGDSWIAATIQSCRDLFLLFFVVGAVHFILVLLDPRRSGVVDSALTVHGLDPLLRTCRAAAAHGKTYQRLRNISIMAIATAALSGTWLRISRPSRNKSSAIPNIRGNMDLI